jgi:hypothetical protein
MVGLEKLNRRIVVSQKARVYFQNEESKKSWRHGSSIRTSA